MKKMMLAAAVMTAAMAFGEMKIGTVDMLLLVRNHPSYEVNKSLLKDTEKEYRDQIGQMESVLDDIQEEGRKLAEELKNPMLAEAAKQKTEKSLMELQQRYVRQQQELRAKAMENQQKLNELETKVLKAQAEDLRARIATFAASEGYDLVLDSAAAIYAKDALDVSDKVLVSMKVDPKAARAKETNESK